MNQNTSAGNARCEGFSLIELMVVITIIGILASVVVMSVADKTDDSKQTRVRADFKTINTAVNMFKIDHGRYPESVDELVNGPVSPTSSEPTEYLDSIPFDPWTQEDYIWDVDDDNKPYFTSYGMDMTEGGEGFNGDIISNEDKRQRR